MAAEIGSTLRETRNRLRIDLADVEARTKIRVRYLRALENEEWDVLPGGAYTRSFIRTYANHLGLDGERLADDYRRRVEAPPGERIPRPEPVAPSRGRRLGAPRRHVPTGILAGLIALALIGVLVAIGLAGGDGDGGEQREPRAGQGAEAQQDRPPPDPRLRMELTATAPVWTCLIDAAGRELVDGRILATGQSAGPFRSKGFSAAFGNGSVEMTLDGEPAALDPSPNPAGYRIGREGGIAPLPEGERPTCE